MRVLHIVIHLMHSTLCSVHLLRMIYNFSIREPKCKRVYELKPIIIIVYKHIFDVQKNKFDNGNAKRPRAEDFFPHPIIIIIHSSFHHTIERLQKVHIQLLALMLDCVHIDTSNNDCTSFIFIYSPAKQKSPFFTIKYPHDECR